MLNASNLLMMHTTFYSVFYVLIMYLLNWLVIYAYHIIIPSYLYVQRSTMFTVSPHYLKYNVHFHIWYFLQLAVFMQFYFCHRVLNWHYCWRYALMFKDTWLVKDCWLIRWCNRKRCYGHCYTLDCGYIWTFICVT